LKTSDLDRRDLLRVLAAGALLPACDRVVVNNENQDGLVTMTEDGVAIIPPITANEDFYIYSCCGAPEVDPDTWTCAIMNRGEVVAEFDLEWLTSTFEPEDHEMTLQCIGSSPRKQFINNAIWTGVPLRDVLDELGFVIEPEHIEVRMQGVDGYDASLLVEDVDAPIRVVWKMNGDDLHKSHGAPVRLMVPGHYGTKNIKWIAYIDFVDEPHSGYWDSRGWSKRAEYKCNGFISVPRWGAEVESPVRVLGTAFAGSDPVAKVEVQIDGAGWQNATIDYSNGPDVWTLWSYEWKASAGGHTIQVRVTSESGAVTVMDPEGTNKLNGYDGGDLVYADFS